MSAVVSKKRKRNEEPAEISLELSSQDTAQIGAVLASFPAIHPTKSVPYKAYLNKKEPNKPFSEQDVTIVGETDSVEFVTGPETQVAAAGCRCTQQADEYDCIPSSSVAHPDKKCEEAKESGVHGCKLGCRLAQRNKLGETFGTKKAKTAIRAQERNRIDVDAMRGAAGHIQDRIEENTTSLPTREEAKAAADENRLIPPHNLDAERPDDVYALHDVIPEAEWKALTVSALKHASSDKERRYMLPYSRSEWINQHLLLAFAAPSVKTNTLKILFYVSAMMAFKQAARAGDKKKLQERLKSVPSIVVDGLVSRFMETPRESNEPKITSQTETSLLTHMFVLCLRVDDFASDSALIAKDLSMPPASVNALFKSLGCKIGTKRAILRTPVVFPTVKFKRARR
ncbi:hypothetical protein EUX98_g7263 [Antrodiella citrinella]|uniref:DNA-directed RNA polymerase I subunit RPA49 n=1 Tax=Antrodiella citrinella TaxID=2447956 RepID=A0A4S4MPE2_9APHY|nr:hypothetical protein EUX98_g7263 [Antrodiella citrinella]